MDDAQKKAEQSFEAMASIMEVFPEETTVDFVVETLLNMYFAVCYSYEIPKEHIEGRFDIMLEHAEKNKALYGSLINTERTH